MAAALQLTPTLFDGYYRAARQVIDDALDDHPAYRFSFPTWEVGVPGGYPVGDLWALSGNAYEVSVTVPEGEALVSIVLGASQIGPAPAPELRLEIDGVAVEAFVVPGSAAALQEQASTVSLSAGTHVVRYVPTNFMNDAPANTSNNVIVRTVEVRSTTTVRGPGRDLVYVCDPSGSDSVPCYHEIVSSFARRAWRRPLQSGEDAKLTRLWDDLRASGESDDQALRLVLRAILISPSFLYRARTVTDEDRPEWVDPYVLASRLSYFLWSSTPDPRLLAAAEAGDLSDEERLADVVAWMLRDERARGLLDGFAEQWLSIRGLHTASPSPEHFPEFDASLRAAMADESRLFFADYLENGLPVATFLRPGFAYRNDRLATHYGLAPVESAEMVRVGADGRAGLLSLGAWLTAQSDSERSSPIKRGRWLSDRILCRPVPPPPAGLVIDPIPVGETELTTRQQLEAHRNDRQCASCHSLLDVLGMGFEEFDGIARFRGAPELDTMGELPNGTTFEGADELASSIDDAMFVGCLTEKLFMYALGRTIQSRDAPYVREVAERAASEESTLSGLITAIVLSPPFRAPATIAEGASR
jgi:hypothetical protein